MLASPQSLRKVAATVTFADVSKVSFIVRFSNEKYSHSLTKYLNNLLTKEKAWLQKNERLNASAVTGESEIKKY